VLLLACVGEDVSVRSVADSTTTDIVSTVVDAVTDTTSGCVIDFPETVFETGVSWSVAVAPRAVAVCPAELVLWLAVVKDAAAGSASESSDAVVVSWPMADGSVVIVDGV
jgi:hypothetical protein